jgi:hypothetical protein
VQSCWEGQAKASFAQRAFRRPRTGWLSIIAHLAKCAIIVMCSARRAVEKLKTLRPRRPGQRPECCIICTGVRKHFPVRQRDGASRAEEL